MNDEAIKKALECCLDVDAEACSACPISNVRNCNVQLFEEIKLYFEQQAEIEQLKSLCTSKDVIIKAQEAEIDRLKYLLEREEKATESFSKQCYKDGIKEFAERLKEDCPDNLLVIHFDAIDKLVKEMVGENNDKM